MNRPTLLSLGVLSLALSANTAPARADIAARPDVGAFIQEMTARRHLDSAELARLFGQVDIQRKIIDAMNQPAEAKPWWEYRKLLLTDAQIQGGVEFWRRNRAALEEASNRYHVAPEMVVAILGAESHYGKNLGGWRVIDALSTLAFEYPRRAGFFRKELEEFLLMCREEAIDPLQPKGSYAGAMGMPQFMPSSYRQYAVDMDGDRRRNIWSNPADAIGSVAHYFARFGWKAGEAVAVPATVVGDKFRGLLGGDLEPKQPIAQWRGLGVQAAQALPDTAPAKLLALDTQAGPEYWLGLHNFYVITRYNHSPLYAMAAYQLGKAIGDFRHAETASK